MASITFTPIKRDGSLDTTVITITGKGMPTGADVEDNTTSISYNTVLGDFIDNPIALKRKLILKWDILDDSLINQLYFNGLLEREKTNKRRFYKIEVTGNSELAAKIQSISTDGIFYMGTPVRTTYLGEMGNTKFWSIEIHFIQKSPYALGGIPGVN